MSYSAGEAIGIIRIEQLSICDVTYNAWETRSNNITALLQPEVIVDISMYENQLGAISLFIYGLPGCEDAWVGGGQFFS